jgi:hypothetical protein
VRVQMLFMTARDSVTPLFYEISHRSAGAALIVDDISSRFETMRVPDDLRELHTELVSSLHGARTALDRLAASAGACQIDAAEVQKCQVRFAAASSALSQAYTRYLNVRMRIRDQIADTHNALPEFRPRGQP